MVKPIALILLNWNTKYHTEKCISSLKKYTDETLFDIIVADNGSTDESLTVLKILFPDLIYLDNKVNLGFAEGNNKAIDLAIKLGYEYSLLLNTDTIVEEDLVNNLLMYLRKNKTIAAVQPAIYYLHNKNKLWNGVLDFNQFWGYTYSKKKIPTNPISVKWITGCCFLIRNEVLMNVGKFNNQFFIYYEDVELFYRIKANGYELHFLPNVKVYHEAGVSGQLPNKSKEGTLNPIVHYYLTRNKIWFLRKYGNRFYLPFNVLNALLYNFLILTYFILLGKKIKTRYLIKGLKDGLFTPSKFIWQV